MKLSASIGAFSAAWRAQDMTHLTLMVNTPTTFQLLMKIVDPILTDRVRAKFRFCSLKQAVRYMSAATASAAHGGTGECVDSYIACRAT